MRSVILGGLILLAVGFFIGTHGPSSWPPAAPATETIDFAPLNKAMQLLDDNFVPATTTPKLTNDQKLWGAITGLTNAYGDPYTTFFPPKEKTTFQTQVQGNFEGVGMEIAIRNDVLTVVTPLKGSPAFEAGIKTGDLILKIDGKSTEGLSVEDAVSKIRGPGGTSVTLTLARGDKQPFDVSVVRRTINLPTIDTTLRKDGVFVIQFYSFNALSPELFRNAIREFAQSGSNKMIIDLRGNPGGYLEAAVDVASWFLPVGKTVVSEDFAGKQDAQVHRSRGYDVFTDNLKLVVLIDGGSASASEILAGALHDYGKATLIGDKSFGKGSVQQVFDITDTTSIKITIARWLTPKGTSISHEGIAPDIEVQRTEEDAKAGRDPQLDRAVQFLLTGK